MVPLLLAAVANNPSSNLDKIEQARQILNEGVTSNNPNSRKEAALAIGLVGQHEHAATLLISLLQDKDVQVRVAATDSLTDLRDKRAIPALTSALNDPVPEVAFAAAKALWAMKQPIGEEALLSVLEGQTKGKSNPVRRQFRERLRTVKIPKSALLFALKEGFGFIPVPGVGAGFAAMESLFWDTSLSPRASVALLLAQNHDPKSRDALLQALFDGDWTVRAAAAQAIALRNQPALGHNLVPLLDDKNEKVRYRAAAGYLRLVQLERNAPRRNAGRSGR